MKDPLAETSGSTVAHPPLLCDVIAQTGEPWETSTMYPDQYRVEAAYPLDGGGWHRRAWPAQATERAAITLMTNLMTAFPEFIRWGVVRTEFVARNHAMTVVETA